MMCHKRIANVLGLGFTALTIACTNAAIEEISSGEITDPNRSESMVTSVPAGSESQTSATGQPDLAITHDMTTDTGHTDADLLDDSIPHLYEVEWPLQSDYRVITGHAQPFIG
ncbi:MAG: hypothetical protein AB4042_04060 [Leptolyngbyaceae cyanobacterium]